MTRFITTLAVLLAIGAAPAQAGDGTIPHLERHAIVIGANDGGAGQEALSFAENDASNVARVLVELGGFERSRVHVLKGPSPRELLARLRRVRAPLQTAEKAGRQTVFFFYYSGHSKANAINLGRDELELDRLRERIMAMPATLRVVVLDACQSGAFSNVKGASPAGDFSINSVGRLGARGTAVVASSSATELSQESEKLGSSFFTHYLVVGLRGAADKNRDGRVALDEAYRYAYERTLVATATTRVGKQHVTLETDLRGRGDIPLTYVARAQSRLTLPSDLRADVLIENRRSGAVVAEVAKAPGRSITLALPRGSYYAYVDLGKATRRCQLDMTRRPQTLAPGQCPLVTHTSSRGKGKDSLLWAVEGGIGFGFYRKDQFVERLEDFGYRDPEGLIDVPSGHFKLSALRRISDRGALALTVQRLGAGDYIRTGDTSTIDYSWTTYAAGLSARYVPWRLYQGAMSELNLFAELGVGVAIARTRLDAPQMREETDYHKGYYTATGVGLAWTRRALYHPFAFGLTLRVDAAYAPVIDNLLGDTHDSGGLFTTFGYHMAF